MIINYLRRLADYREFHLRDTPKGQTPTDANDVLVVYKIDKNDLILVGIRVGSHERLFCGKNTAKSIETTDFYFKKI